MGDEPADPRGATKGLLVVVIVFAITWFLFWEFLQPALANLSPIFIYEDDIWTGRYPDSPVSLAFIVFGLFGLLVALLLRTLIYEGFDQFTDVLWAIYTVAVTIPFGIVVSIILPKFGIDRWDTDSTEDDS